MDGLIKLLHKKIDKTKDFLPKERAYYMKKIKTMKKREFTIIYILIIKHHNSIEKKFVELPYDMVVKDNGIHIKFNSLPELLKKMLYQFAVLHSKSTKKRNK